MVQTETRRDEPNPVRQLNSAGPRESPFTEAEAWRAVGAGWQPLFGNFQSLGLSIEWHEFQSAERLDWAKSFHPGSVEICLNLAGHGHIARANERTEYGPLTAGFYCCGSRPLAAHRDPLDRHQFVTVEFAPRYLARHLAAQEEVLQPLLKAIVKDGKPTTGLGPTLKLTSHQHQLALSLRQPPVQGAAQSLWYQGKALELMAEFFIRPGVEELFCVRQKRVAQERAARVVAILNENLAEPPSLEEISRQAGCSPFYLSRTFSRVMGMTILQCSQKLRLQRAAELLRTGKYNVTEAALEVGYASLSHFGQAFREYFGCCPGLYPSTTPAQKAARGAAGSTHPAPP